MTKPFLYDEKVMQEAAVALGDPELLRRLDSQTNEELLKKLLPFVARLSKNQLKAVILFHFPKDGVELDFDKLGEIMGVTRGKARNYLIAAMSSIRKMMREAEERKGFIKGVHCK